MNRPETEFAVVLAGMPVLSVPAPVGAALATEDDPGGSSITVLSGDAPLVTVTKDDEPAAYATVEVTVDENASADERYAGVGTYTTGENGTVELPEPTEDVTVEVTAKAADDSERSDQVGDSGEDDGDARDDADSEDGDEDDGDESDDE